MRLFAESAAARYKQWFSTMTPTLGAHVDDMFGGFKHCTDYNEALRFRKFLITVISALTVVFKPKEKKTPLPTTSPFIIGRLFNSITRRINTAESKRTKYRLRRASMLIIDTTTRNELERIHGFLNYMAYVKPFGRPLLRHLTDAMAGMKEGEPITLSPLARLSLKIWDLILEKNKCISMDCVLKRLPRAQSDIFVDASGSWGVGGFYGRFFFAIP